MTALKAPRESFPYSLHFPYSLKFALTTLSASGAARVVGD